MTGTPGTGLDRRWCGCRVHCGDDGDNDGPGTCRGLRLPPMAPLVEVVLVPRSARLQAAEEGERSTQYEADHYRARLREVEFSLREAEEALRWIADYGHEMDDYEPPPGHNRKIARSYFAAQETNDPPPPRDSGISSA